MGIKSAPLSKISGVMRKSEIYYDRDDDVGS